MDLAAEAKPGVIFGLYHTGFGLPQRCQDFLGIVANARNNTNTGNDDTAHDGFSLPQAFAGKNKPTRRSAAV